MSLDTAWRNLLLPPSLSKDQEHSLCFPSLSTARTLSRAQCLPLASSAAISRYQASSGDTQGVWGNAQKLIFHVLNQNQRAYSQPIFFSLSCQNRFHFAFVLILKGKHSGGKKKCLNIGKWQLIWNKKEIKNKNTLKPNYWDFNMGLHSPIGPIQPTWAKARKPTGGSPGTKAPNTHRSPTRYDTGSVVLPRQQLAVIR